MISQGDVISYLDMCKEEGVNLQRGMNFRLRGGHSVILMSLRLGAPYADRIEDEGKTLIYEGHDVPATKNGPHPKEVDQPERNPGGGLTQNGLFYRAALQFKEIKEQVELIKVYEKMRSGIWVFNGFFRLIDAWREHINNRSVFKFKLKLVDEVISDSEKLFSGLDHLSIISTAVSSLSGSGRKGLV